MIAKASIMDQIKDLLKPIWDMATSHGIISTLGVVVIGGLLLYGIFTVIDDSM